MAVLPGDSGGWWSDFATGEFAVRVITPVLVATATSMIVGGINRRRDQRDKRNESVLDELKACLSTIQDASAAVATDVETHLLGITEGPIKDSQRRIGVKMKAVGRHIGDAKVYLYEHDANALENAFLRWDDGLTGEGYPIQQKAQALKPHDPVVKRVQTAQAEWQQFLTDFKLRCIKGKCVLKHKV